MQDEIEYNTTLFSVIYQKREYENARHNTFVYVTDTFGLPTVFFVGLMGNLTSLLIFANKELRSFSSSVYILATVISDITFLVSVIVRYFNPGSNGSFHLKDVCYVVDAFSNASSFLSMWFFVCLTVDMHMAVCRPSLALQYCTVRHAVKVCTGLALTTVVVYVLLLVNMMDQHCYPASGLLGLWPILAVSEAFLALIVPSVATISLIARIILQLQEDSRRAYHFQDPQIGRPYRCKPINRQPHVRAAKMLLFLSVATIVMRLPSCATRTTLAFQLYSHDDVEHSAGLVFASAICIFIYQSSFAVKFFVFILCGENFRKVLRQCIKKLLC